MAAASDITPEWPFRTLAAYASRLDRHSDRSDPNVCWPWSGYGRVRGGCCICVSYPNGRRRMVQVKHLTWWMAHREQIMRPIGLRPTCGTTQCVNPAHFRRINSRRERRWTDKEVERMRTEYWGTPARPGRRLKGNRPQDYVFKAARSLGLEKGTIQRVIDGKPIYPAKWARPPLTPDEILEAVERAKVDTAAAQARFDSKLSQRAMAGYTGEGPKPPLTAMLRGLTYRRAGGPTGPVRQVADALDEDEELAEL